MIPIETLFASLREKMPHQKACWDHGQNLIETLFQKKPHGHWQMWENLLQTLPKLKPSFIDLHKDILTIGKPSDISENDSQELSSILKQLGPWRKGPYQIFNTVVDAEWRCDKKWNRIKEHLPDLRDKCILDVGSGNGYFAWKCANEKAHCVLAVDHNLLCFIQFLAVQRYMQSSTVTLLPLSFSSLLGFEPWNDFIFSMGVLYHQNNPIQHLLDLRSLLKQGGFLILETLFVSSEYADVFFPQNRYARMRNVSMIPSERTLNKWLKNSGFELVKCLNQNKTSCDEQRTTPWMMGESLKEFLNKDDNDFTVENYPAPQRIVVLAKKS